MRPGSAAGAGTATGTPASRVATTTIVDCSGVGAGGVTRVLSEVVRHWPAGHRLEIVSAPASWEPPAGHHAEVTVVSRQHGSRGRTITAAAAALRQATGRAADDRSRPAVLSLSPSLAVVGSRLPVTTIVHDLAFKLWPYGLPTSVRRYRRVSYGAAIGRSDRLLCVSARTQHDLFGLYGVPAERSPVWHPGSDLVSGSSAALAHALPPPLAYLRERSRPYLLVTGHAAHKGVELAIEALPSVPGYVLAVLTGGRRVEPFEAAAARLGDAGRVLFLDRLDDAAYAAAVSCAAAFLMPSHFEGYGLPAAEAVRLGTPTVVSPDPALHEATGGAAIRMDSWTAAAMVRALGELDRHLAVPRDRPAGRSWAEATAELFSLLSAAADGAG